MKSLSRPESPSARRGVGVAAIVALAAGVLAVAPLRAAGPQLKVFFASDFTDAALDAVTKAAPFDPLPKGYPRPSVEVHFHFEYL